MLLDQSSHSFAAVFAPSLFPEKLKRRMKRKAAKLSTTRRSDKLANRTLFHLRTVDEIRASFAKRDEGAHRNVWFYSYNQSSHG